MDEATSPVVRENSGTRRLVHYDCLLIRYQVLEQEPLILFSQFIFGWLVVLLVIQAALVARFWFKLTSHRPEFAADEDCPPAAVILCVRGNDPTLESCIHSLLKLDYPDLTVRVVADSNDDPALATVERIVEAESDYQLDIQLMTVNEIRDTCSLKCGALVEAVEQLREQVEIIALIDADTQTHETWLRELVAAMKAPAVGAATGIRWYTPVAGSFGSTIRYIWNAAAIVQMESYKIAWGGTLAFKSEVFADGEVLKRWANAFCEDTMTQAVLRERDLKLVHVPSLVMVSREATGVGGVVRWIGRQLLTSRLYHPAWLLVVSHGFSTTVAPLLCLIGLFVSLVVGNHGATICLAAGIVMYELCAIAMLVAIEHAARTAAGQRAAQMKWFSPARLPEFVLGLIATQIAYAWAMTGAIFQRRFDWRGIEYDVRGPRDIRMESYVPYSEIEGGDDEEVSL